MVIGDQHFPLVTGQQPYRVCTRPVGRVDALLSAGAAEHERPGIGRVRQEIVDRRIGRRCPADPRATVASSRQQQPVLAQRQQYLSGRAELVEAAKDCRDRFPHRLIRGDDHTVVGVVVQPDRQSLAQLSAGGLVPQPGGQPRADQVQLGL